VEARNAMGGIAADFDGTVTLTLHRGAARMGGLLGTTSVQAVNGVASFPDLQVTSPAENYFLEADADGTISGESVPFTIGAAVLFVRPSGSDSAAGVSWVTAKRTIAAAAASPLCVPGTEIWAAAGTYAQPVTLKSGTALYGGFDGTETDRDARDWTKNVTIVQATNGVTAVRGAAQPVTIDGITIRNAADAIYLLQTGAFIRNNAITGAIRGITADFESVVVVENNVITGCRQGALSVVTPGSIVRGNRIVGNTGDNLTGGVSVTSTLVERNVIAYNTSRVTGGLAAGPGSVVRDNLILGNATEGGPSEADGILAKDGAIIANNTIVGNGAGTGAILAVGTPVIVNNIIAYNAAGISEWSLHLATPVVSNNLFFSNVTGNAPGLPDPIGQDGNIEADPGFVSLTTGDLHIRPDSPARDAGDNAAVADGLTDMDGQPRIQDGRVDIGADESDGSLPSVPATIVRVSPSGSDANDGATWAATKRTIPAAIAAVSAHGGGEVWVKAGAYYGNVILESFCHLYGGFAGTETVRDERDPARNVTTLDARGVGSVVAAPVGVFQATLDGFTVQNGGPSVDSPRGGYGVLGSSSASVTISHNVIRNNLGMGVICGALSVVSDNHVYGNGGDLGGGVFAGGAAVVTGNIIERNTSTSNIQGAAGGLEAYGTGPVSYNVIRDNAGAGLSVRTSQRVFGNVITGNDGEGVWIGYGAPDLRNNVIAGNAVGVSTYRAGALTLANNTIVDNAQQGYLGWFAEAPPVLVNNIVAYNEIGVSIQNGVGAQLPDAEMRANDVFGNATNYDGTNHTGENGNISADPKLAYITGGNYHIQPNSPCRDAGDATVLRPDETDMDGQPRVQGTGVDIGADESDLRLWRPVQTVIRVRPGGNDANDGSTWALARATVQAAVDAASASGGGDVWVAAGTYAERLSLGARVRLYGGFAGTEAAATERDPKAHETVLDGEQQGSVIVAVGTNRGTVVDGFTLRNGHGSAAFVGSAYRSRGGGVFMSGSTMTVSNNVIENNTADDGAGIYAASGHAYPGSAATIVNNVIRDNTGSAYGGGVYIGGSGLMRGNLIENNTAPSGGGVFSSGAADALHRPNILNNVIRANRADKGGGLYNNVSWSLVAGNLFEGNVADTRGGGLYIPGTAYAANNTVVGNSAPLGGGVDTDNTFEQPSLINNIVAFNSSGIIANGRVAMVANDVYGNEGFAGAIPAGNIQADPLFEDASAGNYRLTAGSPCVDAGSGVAYTDTDLDGAPRISGSRIDMGAYEFHGAAATSPGLDARTALRIAGGLASRPASGGITIADAVRTAQQAANVTSGQ
jgi:hypothetical protein